MSHQDIIERLVKMSADFGKYAEGAALQMQVDRLAEDLQERQSKRKTQEVAA